MYYSGWYVPFPTGFAKTVANHGAVPLVQMDPDGINIARIASGHYDGYLSAYAEAVRAYQSPGHPELRARDERQLVLLGLPAHISGGFRGRLAAYRQPFPSARCPERDLAVDRQHHQRLTQRQGRRQPEAVVARQFVCHLGRDRRLLPQAQLAVRSACSGRPSARSAR